VCEDNENVIAKLENRIESLSQQNREIVNSLRNVGDNAVVALRKLRCMYMVARYDYDANGGHFADCFDDVYAPLLTQINIIREVVGDTELDLPTFEEMDTLRVRCRQAPS
jgi:hypothetical protein